jgi:hypothetical protein
MLHRNNWPVPTGKSWFYNMSGLIERHYFWNFFYKKGRSGRGPTNAISPFNTLRNGKFVDAGFTHKFPNAVTLVSPLWKNSSVTFGIILHTPDFQIENTSPSLPTLLVWIISSIINGISNTIKGIKTTQNQTNNESPISKPNNWYNLYDCSG